MPCTVSTSSADFVLSGAVCDPTRPEPASSSATSKHRQNSRVPKNQIYFPVVSLKFANSVAGPPPLQRERQLGAGSHGVAAQRTFLKMSKLARLLKMLASICRGEMKACQGKMREDIWGSGQGSGFSGSVYGAVEVEAPTMS